MLGTARHSQGSGEYFPTQRTIPLSWHTTDINGYSAPELEGYPDIGGTITTYYDGSGFVNGYNLTKENWTLAYWFKFANRPLYGYSNFAQPLHGSLRFQGNQYLGNKMDMPFVTKSWIGWRSLGSQSFTDWNNIPVNLANDVWYSVVFSKPPTGLTQVWLNGQYMGTMGDPATPSADDYAPSFGVSYDPRNVSPYPNAQTLGSDWTRYSDLWLAGDYINFNADPNKLRFFYDYRIGAPALSGGLSSQTSITNLSSGFNIITPATHKYIGDYQLGFSGAGTPNSGVTLSFTDTPTT